jgi:enamine deaminase RidA (YjgF/YER057c/UK114 family)
LPPVPAVERIKSDRVPRPLAHYTQGSRVGDLIFLAGQLASDFRTGVPAELRRRPGYPYYGSDIVAQTEYVLTNIKANLEDAGSDLDHVLKAQVFLLDCALSTSSTASGSNSSPRPRRARRSRPGRRGCSCPGRSSRST